MPETVAAGEYLTVQEAAERKGVKPTAIYKAISEGRLVASKVLGRVALRTVDVDAYEPGSYGEAKRAVRPRGPGRGKKGEQAV